jgi:small-conductance mechanosensitive channel
MHSHLAQEWAAAWPLPAVAIALLVVLSFLRPVVDAAERGRVKAGIFFTGAYLVLTTAFGVLRRPMPTPPQHDWFRVLAVLLLCFAIVIAGSLLVFDVALRRRHIPRILQDLVQGIAYFIVAAIVLTRSDVDVTRVFTASVLTTAVLGLALQDTLGNVMAGLALQLERDFEVGDWINVGDRAAPLVGRIREVRWRATTITTKNGDLMLIPNSAITRAMITNFSRPTSAHRKWVNVQVHFRHPPARVRHKAVPAIAAVVGGDDHFIAVVPELVFPEHQVAAAETDDGDGAVPHGLVLAELRVDRRHAQAAAYQHDGSVQVPEMVESMENGTISFGNTFRESKSNLFMEQLHWDPATQLLRPTIVWPAELKQTDFQIPDWYRPGGA